MSFTVFLGNLPAWVTADDIRGWLAAENLVADAIKVIRNPETQESKGFAFIDAPNTEEMNAIIRRFDRAPLEDRLLRANPAQPPKPKGQVRPTTSGTATAHGTGTHGSHGAGPHASYGHGQPRHDGNPPAQTQRQAQGEQRPPRRGKRSGGKRPSNGGANSAFAEELAKAL
jgi:RNA recognition motif-containing protein